MLLYYFLNFTDNLKLAFANWIPLFGMPRVLVCIYPTNNR